MNENGDICQYMPSYKTVRKILKDRMLVRNRGNLRCIKDVFKIFVLGIRDIVYLIYLAVLSK